MAGPLSLVVFATYTLLLHLALIAVPTHAGNYDTVISQRNSSADLDLVSFLSSRTRQHDAIFTEAVHILESMRSSPSCNRIAASKLVTSCQSIGGQGNTNPEEYIALEHVRSLYAARLAICEINGAGTSTPTSCLSVIAFTPSKKSLFGFSSYKSQVNPTDPPSAEMLANCLMSLESRPQWWTSYSNSRQNAVVICQAARIENEREELIELHRSIVDSSVKLNHGLQEALRTAAEYSARQRDFVHAVEVMQAQMAQDFEERQSRFWVNLDGLFADVETGVTSMFATVKSAFGDVQTEVSAIEKGIQNASEDVRQLHQTLQDVHSGAIARNDDLVIAQQQASMLHRELALALRTRLEEILQADVAELSQSVEGLDSSLDWLSARLGHLLQQEQTIAQRLQHFEASLDESKLKADTLNELQLQQFEAVKAQSEMQESLKHNMKISQAIIEKTSAAAIDLQAMIDTTASRYKQIPMLGSMNSPASIWTLCGLLGVIGARNARLAAGILGVGAFHILMTQIL